MILSWRLATVCVLVEGASVADEWAAHDCRGLLYVASAMLSLNLCIVPASLARRLQYHLLSSFIFAFLRVVDLLILLLLLGRHLLALLVARSYGLRLVGVHRFIERIIVCKIVERVSRQRRTIEHVVVQF